MSVCHHVSVPLVKQKRTPRANRAHGLITAHTRPHVRVSLAVGRGGVRCRHGSGVSIPSASCQQASRQQAPVYGGVVLTRAKPGQHVSMAKGARDATHDTDRP